jgi:hypothetical protein
MKGSKNRFKRLAIAATLSMLFALTTVANAQDLWVHQGSGCTDRAGAGYNAVCQQLNAEGITARDGGAWSTATVRRIVLRG